LNEILQFCKKVVDEKKGRQKFLRE